MTDFLLQERQALIYERLNKAGRVFSAELAVEFAVSEDTIRRDLRDMAAAGLCQKVYGGALPCQAATRSLAERAKIAGARKQDLGKAAVPLIKPDSVVFFDAGSTVMAIADALGPGLSLTAVTNAPAIACVLMTKPLVDVILLGGMIDPAVGGAVGTKAQQDLSALSPDLCILGACGIDGGGHVRAFHYQDADLKRFAASRSTAVLVAVTADKFEVSAPYSVLPLGAYQWLATETGADPDRLLTIAAAGCNIVLAKD